MGAAHADGAHSKRFFALDPRGTPPARDVAAGGRPAGDVVRQSRDAGAPLISAHPCTAPGGTATQVSVAPWGASQLRAAGVASAGAPPGIERPAALTAATSQAGGWTGGLALPRPADPEGQRGGASLVPLGMTDPRPPHASSGSLGDGGATRAPGPMQERDSRIISFLAGPQFGLPAGPGGSAGGTPSLMGASVAAPAFAQPHLPSCGAAPGMIPEAELLGAADPGQPPQSGNAGPDASGSGPSMAELNMVLKTLPLVGGVPEAGAWGLGHPCQTAPAVAPTGDTGAGAHRTPRHLVVAVGP